MWSCIFEDDNHCPFREFTAVCELTPLLPHTSQIPISRQFFSMCGMNFHVVFVRFSSLVPKETNPTSLFLRRGVVKYNHHLQQTSAVPCPKATFRYGRTSNPRKVHH
ncbi:hypothetical protein TNCT_501141 [Trichonephila clavata]|uniref:Uncharacterized protein n=1 Tax=Trichonephila clavata TaxID=2740835 RepID=A0A8X6FZ86_TRICU|nr:hypothetical protein TNCT_501141 [Trichonephila clavata]